MAWAFSGQQEVTARRLQLTQMEELVGSGGADFYFRNFAQGWPAEGVNRQINYTQ